MDRQRPSIKERARLTPFRAWVISLTAGSAYAGWFLHKHDRFDVLAATIVAGAIMAIGFTAATAVICRHIATSHEITRRHQEKVRQAEEDADNVFPIHRDPIGEVTMALPVVVVGRAAPVIGAGAPLPKRPRTRLSYTAGDNTVDCFVRDVLNEEGNTG